MDIHWGILRGWVKTTGNVMWLKMSKGTCAFGWGNDVTAHRCHRIVNLETNATTHGTGSWLARPDLGSVMGKYPSMSGRGMSRCLPPLCGVLPPIWKGTLTAHRGVTSHPCCTWINNDYKNQSWQQPNSNHPTVWAWGHAHQKRGGWMLDHPILQTAIDSIVVTCLEYGTAIDSIVVTCLWLRTAIDSIGKIPFIKISSTWCV